MLFSCHSHEKKKEFRKWDKLESRTSSDPFILVLTADFVRFLFWFSFGACNLLPHISPMISHECFSLHLRYIFQLFFPDIISINFHNPVRYFANDSQYSMIRTISQFISSSRDSFWSFIILVSAISEHFQRI